MESFNTTATPKQLNKAAIATRFIFFLCGLALSSWAPMIPYVKERLNLSDADLGLVLFEFGIGALMIMPMTGWLVHKFGSSCISLAASSLLIVLLPLLAVAPNPLILGIALFLFGTACGATNVAINSQAVAVETHLARPVMSGFHCLFSVGGLSGAAFMSLLLKMGWQLSSCAIAVSAVIAIILLSQLFNLLPHQYDIKASAASSFAWPGSKTLFLGILCFIMFLAEGAMLDWSAVYLTFNNYDEAIAGIGYAVFSIAMALGRWTGDKVTQRFGRIKMIQYGGFIAAAGLLIALNIHGYHFELIGFFLVGIGASNVVPLLFSAAGRIPDAPSSLSLTVVTTFGYTGILLGPALIGFAAELSSLSFALTCVASLLVFVGLSARMTQYAEASSS